jgi:thiamine-phosphate pyrophosphorylase
MRRFDLSLYLIADPSVTGGRALDAVVAAAAKGGVTLVQLRDKHATTRQLIDSASRLLAVLRPHAIPLIINDRVDVALAANADGVHVGDEDMPAAEARRLIGPDRILGVTLRTTAQTRAVDREVVDYGGVGPIRASTTKANTAAPRGVDGFAAFRKLVPVPTVAIGGITADLAASLVTGGADGLAIAAGICTAADPAAAAREYVAAIAAARNAPAQAAR